MSPLRFISIGDLYSSGSSKDRYVLGKKFANTIASRRDEKYIIWCKIKFEELKLQIIDAAENGKMPPLIKGVSWFYNLCHRHKEYKFIVKEFDQWLQENGLTSSFVWHDYEDIDLQISLSSYVDFDTVPNPSNKPTLNDVLKSRKNDDE